MKGNSVFSESASGEKISRANAFRWPQAGIRDSFSVWGNPVYDQKGQISRWYVASTDIDDRKRAEERLQLEDGALREEIAKAILCETEIFSTDEKWLPRKLSVAEQENQIELPRRLLAQEKDMIEAALKESGGRVFGPAGAAAKLGIPRSTLESKIRALKINNNRFKI